MKSHSYEKVDVGGASLRCLVEGKKGAPWIVMSHSIATDLHVWDAQVESLADRYQILRFDTRGEGGSDTSPPPYDFPLLVSDVAKLFDHYRIDKACFMGVSLGGMIGLKLALSHPGRVAAFAACDTSMAVDHPVLLDILATRQLSQKAVSIEQRSLGRWFLEQEPEKAALYAQIKAAAL